MKQKCAHGNVADDCTTCAFDRLYRDLNYNADAAHAIYHMIETMLDEREQEE